MSKLRYASCTEEFPPHVYVFTTIPCPDCGESGEVRVPGEELFRYHQGGLLQDACPSVSPGDRERLFMTGLCEPCFEAFTHENDLGYPDEDDPYAWDTDREGYYDEGP